MPPPISDRFLLHIRLGRDGDIEEWLGTDSVLDRPVLVRILGPESTPERRTGFLAAVRAGAGVTHDHLAVVFAAGELEQGAYAVEEWAGGVSVADRIAADDPLALEEYLPNAAGLAGALAALHRAGVVHGAIDPSVIEFSTAHPAKLHGLGRPTADATPAADTAALARSLVAAVSGAEPGDDAGELAPSDLRAGLPPTVDIALRRAAAGDLDAAGLAAELRAAPFSPPPQRRVTTSWRWALAAAGLLAVALVVALLGSVLRVRPSDSPFLFPAIPVTSTTRAAVVTTTTVPGGPAPDGVPVLALPTSYDPFGDDTEREADVGRAVDGDAATAWRTDLYFDPLPRVKQGVGLVFRVAGSPRTIDIVAGDGARYSVAWAEDVPDRFAGWEETVAGTIVGGRATHRLPARPSGVWLLWFTELPPEDGGDVFYADVYEVRFLS